MPGSSEEQGPISLRSEVYRSGRFLVGRQFVGMAVKMAGILVVTRLIGPQAYGLYAAVAAFGAVLSTVAIFGIDVQLVRAPPEDEAAEASAFTMLALSSIVVGTVAFLAAPALGIWLGTPEADRPMRIVAALVPVMVLAVPARARLERALRFGPLAAIDLAADLLVYAVAIPLAVAGAGVLAPVGGFAARHLLLLTATTRLAGFRPRLGLDRDHLRAIVRFGSGYSAGKWISVLGQLINPIIVGRLLGPVGVGHVAMASRIIEQLGAVKQATMRLATAAFARLAADRARLRSAHAEAVLIQVLGAVPLYASAAFVAPVAIPSIFGSEWEPAVPVVALLAIAASVGTLFNLAAPILRVLGRNAPVAGLRAWQVATLFAVTTVAVPSLGAAGYGLARLARTVPFVLADRALRREFAPSYGSGLRWLLAFVPMMLAPWAPAIITPLLVLPPVAMLAMPTTRQELARVVRRTISAG